MPVAITSPGASRIGDFIAGDHPRAERTGGGKILARRHGELLIVAHAAVDEAGIAGDVIERALDRNVAATASDDDRKLALEVEALRHRGANHLAVVAGQRVGESDEHARLFRQLAPGLGGMGAVIDAGAENFRRLRNDRQKSYFIEPAIGRFALRNVAHFFQCTGGERRAKAGLRDFIVERYDAIIAQRAEPVFAFGGEA